jgi:hypothetical protein
MSNHSSFSIASHNTDDNMKKWYNVYENAKNYSLL